MSSDEEDYVRYGNALDPIDEDLVPRKKPITVEDQFAKDERGRRRFHGAFTGGFSAGFYNSVGSMEGWQPTQFISSRTNRLRSKNQTIFDFMDDEDTGENGICPMSLQVKPTFDAKSSDSDASNLKKRRLIPTNNQHRALNTWFIRDILAPTQDTIGVMLLMKMGWKRGQGIGPRLTRKEKKRQTLRQRQRQLQSDDVAKKVYGCRLPTDIQYDSEASGSELESDIDSNEITFAPDDYQTYVVCPKQNTFGLGYRGIDCKPVLTTERPELSVLTVAGKSIRGQAFGVSVFEDEDDDIYHTEEMSNYDFSLPHAGEPKSSPPKNESILLMNRNCIEGFHVSVKCASKIKLQPFVLPSIPANFQAGHVKKRRWDCTTTTGNVCKMKVLSAAERSELLNTSVANDEIVQHANSDRSNTATSTCIIQISEIPLPQQTISASCNLNDQMVAGGDAVNVKPFAYDGPKQKRYETFLTLKHSQQIPVVGEMSNIYPSNMTEWEKEREKNEFEQTARLYRPLADDFASRFTRGTLKENVHDISAPVKKSYDVQSEVLRSAAKTKKFGALTRKKFPWKPDKVICKRFNIPEPLDNLSCNLSTAASVSNQPDRKRSLFEFLKMSIKDAACVSRTDDVTTSSTLVTKQAPTPLPSSLQPQIVRNESNIIEQPLSHEANVYDAVAAEDSDNDDQIEKITDKIDLFKAIFLSSSDEDDESIENSNEVESNSNADASSSRHERNLDFENISSAIIKPHTDKKEIRYSPARGIFANLDLESLKCKPSFRKNDGSVVATVAATTSDTTTTNVYRVMNSSNEANGNDQLVYGPKIPSSLLSNVSTTENERRIKRDFSPVREVRLRHSSSAVWVEKSDSCKMKKDKKYRKKQKKNKSRK